ncbi:MAG: SEC-C metal-binding domain-containing protein, partial [Gammaproteobacteria bacterium]|nr:SEC-C metal-binding domain-containing protein [Gammaproteobacteria bacterium]
AELLSRVQIEAPSAVEQAERRRREEAEKRMRFSHQATSALEAPAKPVADGDAASPTQAAPPDKAAPFVRSERKVGRNEPCPCGSGRKYKQCCGKVA